MCGLAGFYGFSNFIPSREKITSCKKLMHRRGPDYSGQKEFKFNSKSIVLLHSRLSIIDPVKNSHQPMENNLGAIAFNGEIYNYIELKKNLINLGYKFFTNSDTEVLLNMLIHYDTKAFSYLDGMWSLAYFNKRNKELILSRDRFGEKPLYTFKNRKGIYFGSTIKYLFELSKSSKNINYNKIKNYLSYGFRAIDLDNTSFFKDIEQVEPASYQKFKYNSFVINKKKYWNFKNIKIDNKIDYEEAKYNVKEAFQDSVKKKLRSDFPISCLLSGGLDSNAIVATALKKFNTKLNCFSIYNKDVHYDESKNINLAVKELQLDHEYVDISKKITIEQIEHIIEDSAYPICAVTWLLYYILNKSVKKNDFRVLFTGIGADELFAGYLSHQIYFLNSLKRNKHKFKKAFFDWETFIKPLVRNKSLKNFNYFNNRKKKLDDVFNANNIDEVHSYLNYKKKIKIPKNKFFKDYFKNQLSNDFFIHNVAPQLRDSDQLSMFNSIENRSPFLNENLFKTAFTLPNNYLINKGYGKFIFRDAMKGVVSQNILESRNKIGFNINISDILNIKSSKFKNVILKNKSLSNFVNTKKINHLIKKSKLNNQESHFLFSVLNIGIFLNKYE